MFDSDNAKDRNLSFNVSKNRFSISGRTSKFVPAASDPK